MDKLFEVSTARHSTAWHMAHSLMQHRQQPHLLAGARIPGEQQQQQQQQQQRAMFDGSVCLQDPTIPQVPFEEKLHAIAYINSNCEAESGRSDLMRALMKLGDNAKVRVCVRPAELGFACAGVGGCCCSCGCERAETSVAWL
jgi:hypothetical protein